MEIHPTYTKEKKKDLFFYTAAFSIWLQKLHPQTWPKEKIKQNKTKQ